VQWDIQSGAYHPEILFIRNIFAISASVEQDSGMIESLLWKTVDGIPLHY
jgi:hypothetical protein